jgi:hypothetical protein
MESSDTIDSVKTKIQDREGYRSSSRPWSTRHLIPASRRLDRQVSAWHDKSLPRMTRLRHAWQVSASHKNFLPSLWLLARMGSLRLRPLVRTSSFRLRLRWGPHMEVGARDQGSHTNVALPRHSSSPATTHKALVLHAMQAPQLAARAGGWFWQKP